MIFIEKSQPSPVCLEHQKTLKNGDYKCGDVLERLNQDFNGKCYLCEQLNPTGLNVEHFRPHLNEDKDLMFSWANLFWACPHCNNIKGDRYNNILDCTIAGCSIESRIRLKIFPFPKESVEIICLDDCEEVKETCKLLDEIYEGTTPLKTMESANLRQNLLDDIWEFGSYLRDYFKPGFPKEHIENKILPEIIRHLSKSAAFTAFKRGIILDNKDLRAEFEKYFD